MHVLTDRFSITIFTSLICYLTFIILLRISQVCIDTQTLFYTTLLIATSLVNSPFTTYFDSGKNAFWNSPLGAGFKQSASRCKSGGVKQGTIDSAVSTAIPRSVSRKMMMVSCELGMGMCWRKWGRIEVTCKKIGEGDSVDMIIGIKQTFGSNALQWLRR